MSQHDGSLIRHYVEQVQVQACKAENGAIVEEEVREIVRQAIDHIAVWKGSAPLENLKALVGSLLGLADMMHDHPVYERVLKMAARMVQREIRSFEPLPLVDTQVGEEKIRDESTNRGKVLRLSTGAHEWMR